MNGENIPNEDKDVESRMIWKVLERSEEKSKNGNFSSRALFLS